MNPRVLSVVVFSFLAAGLAQLSTAEPPKPFTPIKATVKEFRCIGRKTTLGDFLLPVQVTAADKPLLAGPVRLFSEPDIFAGVKGRAKVIDQNGDSARWEWNGESTDFNFTGKMTGDCDGFCWYEIRLDPKHPVKLSSLGLEIPRLAKTARYLHTASFKWGNVSEGLPELGGKWSGDFVPYIWLGDEDRGLAWCSESDEGWQLQKPKQGLTVETRGEMVSFKAAFLDHEATISSPVTFRFGLQSSPVKPVSFAWRANARIFHGVHYGTMALEPNGRCELDNLRDGGVKTVVYHDTWSKYFGQMVPGDADKFRELIDACHKRGMRLLVYVGYGIARTAPELQGKHDEWSVLPLRPWVAAFHPELRSFDATCANSGWADWLVAGVDKLFTDYNLDGLYFDGTSEAWSCKNEAHGCGWKDAQGTVHPVYPVVATRNLMRRVADTVHRHKADAILDVHMSSSLTLPTLAFCDSIWNGEQFEGHTAAEKFEVPLNVFRTEFMGYAHGIDAEFLCYEKRPFTFEEAIALAWVHGVEVRPTSGHLSEIAPIWRAMDRFGVPTARWVPYWNDPVASADSEAVKISAWVQNGKALLFVSHLDRKAASVHVNLDPHRLGFKPVRVKDALAETPVSVNDGNIELGFNGMSYRVLEISKR